MNYTLMCQQSQKVVGIWNDKHLVEEAEKVNCYCRRFFPSIKTQSLLSRSSWLPHFQIWLKLASTYMQNYSGMETTLINQNKN